MRAPATGTTGVLAERVSRRGALALALQETLTATERLRVNRQSATSAEIFRAHIKQLLSAAHDDARAAGYSSEDVKLAVHAAVVFLDESVLNSRNPTFAEWPRRPLQEELFGGHMGGETFFQNLHALLGRQDNDDVADVLEVYQLCLLLGFQGRYGAAGGNELLSWISVTADRIARVRGRPSALSPSWALPEGEVIAVAKDRWVRPLAIVAAVSFAVLCLSSFIFWVAQQSWFSDLRIAAP